MDTARVNAYAKLNLTLDITGTEGGYHMLDSLVVTVDLADRIVAKRRKDKLCKVTMKGMGCEMLPPEENNACKAAEAFVSRFGTAGADITVYKNIPVGAGLGGSSADAAGVLNALARLYDVTDGVALKEVADGVGSDTGYLLGGGFARIRGRGEKVERLGEPPALYFLLICPPRPVSTAACYRAYDEAGKTYAPRTVRVLDLLRSRLDWAARLFGNHLQEAAVSLEPQVAEALLAARSFSPLAAGMTGSGSAAYAAFDTAELAQWAKSRYRGAFRTYCVKTVSGSGEKHVRNPFALDGEG